MNIEEKKRKLRNLPWNALYSMALECGIKEEEVHGKDKDVILENIFNKNVPSDEIVESKINDYIYGDRITFTLWVFHKALETKDYDAIQALENQSEHYLDGQFRNLHILSVENLEDRVEILYVYSKEYVYINEDGKQAEVWEQHRGCVWIGKDVSYLACISKHDKMTKHIIAYISKAVGIGVKQIKPPKTAITKCTNEGIISRIVLQSIGGEKTIVSRSEGITPEQEEEISRIRNGRIDTSGSYVANIDEDTSATLKYNIKKGSIGIYKHLNVSVLFDWSKKTIDTIFEEIEKLKNKTAEEIFEELGLEPKWSAGLNKYKEELNWLLTQTISSIEKEEYNIQLDKKVESILNDTNLFLKIPRVFCKKCDDYDVPFCKNCGRPVRNEVELKKACECGAPVEFVCGEGHKCELSYLFVPTEKLKQMVDGNLKRVFNISNDFNMFILEDNLQITWGQDNKEVEINFNDIDCFKFSDEKSTNELKSFVVSMNEKCECPCSHKNIDECVNNPQMICLPKAFYTILPGFRPQPHKGGEYGDVSAEVSVGQKHYEMKGIIKKNTENKKTKTTSDMLTKLLLSTSTEGQEIIRQFVEQGMNDARCQLIAIIIPQYIDAGLKGTIRFLARLANKKVVFIDLDCMCKIVGNNEKISTKL